MGRLTYHISITCFIVDSYMHNFFFFSLSFCFLLFEIHWNSLKIVPKCINDMQCTQDTRNKHGKLWSDSVYEMSWVWACIGRRERECARPHMHAIELKMKCIRFVFAILSKVTIATNYYCKYCFLETLVVVLLLFCFTFDFCYLYGACMLWEI